MACSCGCSPCNCSPDPVTCCTPTTESVSYTFENSNLVGIGVFDNDTDLLVQFRGIVSDSTAITLVLDAANNVIRLDFDGDLLIGDVPDATTTQRGMLETATDAEALAKAALNKTLTPSNLAALGGTTTFSGFLELATNAETITGTSTTLATTPAGVAAAGALLRTRTFADAVTRAAAVPDFDGQFGNQLDTGAIIVATGTVAGTFSPNIVIGGTLSVAGALTGADASFSTVNIASGGTSLNVTGDVIADGASWQFLNYNLDFSGATLAFNGTPVGATDTVLGQFSSALDGKALSEFISTSNTQTGYTPVTNSATIRTYDCNTVTLPQLAQALGTLIEDLKAVQLPAA